MLIARHGAAGWRSKRGTRWSGSGVSVVPGLGAGRQRGGAGRGQVPDQHSRLCRPRPRSRSGRTRAGGPAAVLPAGSGVAGPTRAGTSGHRSGPTSAFLPSTCSAELKTDWSVCSKVHSEHAFGRPRPRNWPHAACRGSSYGIGGQCSPDRSGSEPTPHSPGSRNKDMRGVASRIGHRFRGGREQPCVMEGGRRCHSL